MEDLLQRLEKQIKELISQHDSLKHNNLLLSQGKHALVQEKEVLLNRQEKAVSQIQTLVSRLKEMGSGHE